MSKVRRPWARAGAVLLGLVGSLGLVASAHADGDPPIDTNEQFEVSDCGFPVRVEFSGKADIRFFDDGRVLITAPGSRLTFTNLADPTRSTSIVATGAFHAQLFPDGSGYTARATGRNVMIGDPGDGSSGISLFVGSYTFTANFGRTEVTFSDLDASRARRTDICALID